MPTYCTSTASGIGDIKKAFAAACKRAGIAGASLHTLKHTAATWLMQAGSRQGSFLPALRRCFASTGTTYQREAAENQISGITQRSRAVAQHLHQRICKSLWVGELVSAMAAYLPSMESGGLEHPHDTIGWRSTDVSQLFVAGAAGAAAVRIDDVAVRIGRAGGTLAGMFALAAVAPADIVAASILYGLTGPAWSDRASDWMQCCRCCAAS